MSDPADTVPQYRLLEPAFYAPDWLPAGSIIATKAPPGPHLEPWNDAAVAAMEAWLTEELPEVDEVTLKPTGRMLRSREKFRRTVFDPGEQQTAVLVEGPEADDQRGQTLAELSLRRSTDQRPAPSRRFKKISPVEDKVAPAPAVASVISKGPKDNTVTGGPS